MFFFSVYCGEPVLVHVQRERMVCKVRLKPLALANNQGFAAIELGVILKLLRAHSEQIVEAWREHFGDDR